MAADAPGAKQPSRRLRHRLPDSAYETAGSTWHVTIGTRHREQRPFSDPVVATAILRVFETRISFYDAILHLGCLMPDYAHLIIQVTNRSLIDVVRDMKSVTTRTWWSVGGLGKLWQESFHDHGVRGMKDFDEIANYILDNPVRQGLVETWEDYPYFCGTIVNSASDTHP